MKPEILHNDHMMFLDRALETQRTALLTAMADAVSECRTAADQAAELTETGEIGLLRLVEILCAAKVQRGQAGGDRAGGHRGPDFGRRGGPALRLPDRVPLCGSAGAGGLCGAFQHGGLPHAGGMV